MVRPLWASLIAGLFFCVCFVVFSLGPPVVTFPAVSVWYKKQSVDEGWTLFGSSIGNGFYIRMKL